MGRPVSSRVMALDSMSGVCGVVCGPSSSMAISSEGGTCAGMSPRSKFMSAAANAATIVASLSQSMS